MLKPKLMKPICVEWFNIDFNLTNLGGTVLVIVIATCPNRRMKWCLTGAFNAKTFPIGLKYQWIGHRKDLCHNATMDYHRGEY